MEFSAANSKLAAILGTTKDGVKNLTDQAKELGRTTSATASQVTGLQIELAKLGFKDDAIINMTPQVLKFANAGFDASSAATASRNILLNLCDANGQLAQALGKPTTNLDELVDGLKKPQCRGS